MVNYKLTFTTNFYGSDISETEKYDRTFTRIIVADRLEEAQVIANAMLGEEVCANEYFQKIVSVEETTQKPDTCTEIPVQNDYAWKRVLHKLSLNESQVEFIYHETKDKKREKVGFVRLQNPVK